MMPAYGENMLPSTCGRCGVAWLTLKQSMTTNQWTACTFPSPKLGQVIPVPSFARFVCPQPAGFLPTVTAVDPLRKPNGSPCVAFVSVWWPATCELRTRYPFRFQAFHMFTLITHFPCITKPIQTNRAFALVHRNVGRTATYKTAKYYQHSTCMYTSNGLQQCAHQKFYWHRGKI